MPLPSADYSNDLSTIPLILSTQESEPLNQNQKPELNLILPKGPTTFKRDESLSHRAARSFDYNDPDLSFRMTPTGPIVMGGTKEKLLLLLTNISIIETRYINEFLAVYPYFASCGEVLDSLQGAFFNTKFPPGISTEEEKTHYVSKIRKRCISVLIRWMENHPRQFFQAGATQKLTKIVEQFEQESSESAEQLQNALKNVRSIAPKFDFMTPRVVTDKTKSPLFTYSSTVLAQQLTLLDQKL